LEKGQENYGKPIRFEFVPVYRPAVAGKQKFKSTYDITVKNHPQTVAFSPSGFIGLCSC